MSYYSDKVLSYSPVAFWRLNETVGPTAADSSGNGYDGTYTGVTLGSYTAPDGSPSPYFDGVNDSIAIYSAGFAAAVDAQEGTLLLWFKVSAAGIWTDGLQHTLFIIRPDSGEYLIVRKSTTHNRLTTLFNSTAGNNINNFDGYSSTDWIPLVIRWSASGNSYKIDIDGVNVLDTTFAGAAWVGALTSQWFIGATTATTDEWDGSEALVAFWDTFLNDAAATDLIDVSVPVPPPPTPSLYIPHELHDILVYDHTGTLQLLLQKWSRLEYHQRLNAPWNHQITIEYGSDDPDLDIIRAIQRDWILIIYRIDPVTGIRYKVYEGFNTTLVDQIRANGGIIINLYGVGYTNLLQRHLALPAVDEEYSTKTGKAETVIKGFVDENMVSPVDADRIFSGVSLAADLGTGDTVTYSARYVNLLSLCEAVSEQGNLDFGMYGGDTIGEFIFDARELWGEDRTEGNTEGNLPVIFSIARDNMLIPILSLNTSDEQNYAYVGGEGAGVDRIIQEVYDADAVALSPWGRKEVFVEARQQADTSALIAAGQLELYNRKANQTLTFNIKQTDSTRWLRDWNLGDLITAKYFTHSSTKQINEVGVVVTSGQTAQQAESINVEMSDERV